MSLINDVLRELADQHKPSNAITNETQSMLPQAPILQSKNFIWFPGVFLFAVVFVVVLSIKHFFYHNPMVVDKNNTPNIVAADINVDGSRNVSEQDINLRKEEDSNFSRQVDTLLQERIADLMQQAERALTMGRLTSPVEDNAHGYYEKILSLKPDYVPAQTGIKKIAALYVVKAVEQKQLGNIVLADTYFQRAKFIDPDVIIESAVSGKNNINQSYDSSTLQEKDGAEVESEFANPPSSTSLGMKASVSVPVQETIKPFVVAEAESSPVEVVTNAGWRDEQLAEHTRGLIQDGKVDEAMALLKPFVATQSRPVHSAIVLAELYLKQNNDQAALVIIEHADYLPVVAKTKINAEIVNMQGDSAAAISMLEKNLTLASDDEKYRALLASLYHKTGNYQQSVLSYQRLISSFGEKPAYWLGLALAFDGLSQHKSALQTYKHLREFPQLQTQVRTYIDQRIATLQSE